MPHTRDSSVLPGRAMGLNLNSSAMAPTSGFGVRANAPRPLRACLGSRGRREGPRGPRLWEGRTGLEASNGERLRERRP